MKMSVHNFPLPQPSFGRAMINWEKEANREDLEEFPLKMMHVNKKRWHFKCDGKYVTELS